ncbi:MAG: hypothetical protein IV100_07495 [Myxococcales bacterium]|nr:hypothetical protein [Myxococcales bacterium]
MKECERNVLNSMLTFFLFACCATAQRVLNPTGLANLQRFLASVGCNSSSCPTVTPAANGACPSGADVSCENGEVTRLVIANVSVSGTIGAELAGLSRLTHLYIANTSISGTLPPEVGSLAKIATFVVVESRMVGAICTEFGLLSSLRGLALNANAFSSLPSQFGLLTDVTHLHFQDNLLAGTFPTQLEQLTDLVFLRVDDNNLVGPPPDVRRMTKLQQLLTYRNRFSGTFLGLGPGTPTNTSWCSIQTDSSTETNCVVCGTATNCGCRPPRVVCSLTTTTRPTTTTTTTTTTTITTTTTTTTPSPSTSTATTSSTETPTSSTILPAPAPPSSLPIGAIVGGLVAAVVVLVAVLAALLLRRKRSPAPTPTPTPTSKSAVTSEYIAFPTPKPNASEYEIGNL